MNDSINVEISIHILCKHKLCTSITTMFDSLTMSMKNFKKFTSHMVAQKSSTSQVQYQHLALQNQEESNAKNKNPFTICRSFSLK